MIGIWLCRSYEKAPQTGQKSGTANWTELRRILGPAGWTALINVFEMDFTGVKGSPWVSETERNCRVVQVPHIGRDCNSLMKTKS